MSLIDMMVGMTVGLLVVAAALLAISHQLRDNQHLIVQARLTQELRSTHDLITRALRRSGPLTEAAGLVRFSNPSSIDSMAYRLREGVIEMQFGSSAWQALTDIQTVRVSRFNVTPQQHEIVMEGSCARSCPEGSSATCPPRHVVRRVDILIEAHAVTDTSYTRQLQTSVRLRNDAPVGACPA